LLGELGQVMRCSGGGITTVGCSDAKIFSVMADVEFVACLFWLAFPLHSTHQEVCLEKNFFFLSLSLSF
jgi:hypothetical protein